MNWALSCSGVCDVALTGLAERRLVEAAKLARMELGAFALQDAQRLDTDSQMLADRPLVKGVGLPGQLDLAVERLVGDAEQGAIGHSEAIALRGDGRRFHVDRDRARLVEAQRRESQAELPVAVVGGYDGAGPEPGLEVLRILAGHLDGRGEQRLLNLGDRRHQPPSETIATASGVSLVT